MTIVRNEETEEIKDKNKVKIEKSDKYIEHVKSDDLITKFSELRTISSKIF